ncbi:hypothetical protein PJ985_01610 [Streptomyces sp. ACA25]|uniref:hypothetical protein n=1 Tax=Streptomyces sp. ACA25 TaxID=3022596 RepID=UPI002307827B|nr:hypothetical protein [Streptomyces sp. ACA25]MDB1086270.1 hypothetical protein [Streptomyces sp. ACA25]
MVGARRTIGTLAGACAVLLAAAGPAPAEEPEAPPTPRPYGMASDAQPVEGTASTSDAPRISAGGIYTDGLEPGDSLYYSLALDDESSAYLATVAAPEPGTKVGYGDGIEVELVTTSGDRCGGGPGRARFQADNGARPIAAWAVRTADPDRDCQSAGPYLYKVTRESDATSSPEVWPIEIRFLEEPPVPRPDRRVPDERDWETEPPAPPAGDATRVVGGTGFSNAPAIGDGVWRDNIVGGQTLIYKMPVDWGQQLAVTVELANASGADDFAYVSYGLMAELYNPALGLLISDSTAYSGDQTSLSGLTPGVSHANRFHSDTDIGRMRYAGWHYLVVTLHEDIAQETEEPIGLTLRTQLLGEPQEAPEYEGDALEAGFGVTEEQREQAEKGRSDEDLSADRQDGKQLMGFAGIGAGSALLLVLGAWYLKGRREAAPSGRQQ